MRSGEGAEQSHRQLFWRSGQHLEGRIPKYPEGFVIPHKTQMGHTYFQFLPPFPALSWESTPVFCLEVLRRGVDKAHHSEVRFSACPQWDLHFKPAHFWAVPLPPSAQGMVSCRPSRRRPGKGPGDSIPEFSGGPRLPGGADVLGAMPTCCVSWPGWQSLGPH